MRRGVPPFFAEITRDTRNYFTHWNPKKQHLAATGANLYALTRCTKGLLEITLLLALGFSKTQTTALVERNFGDLSADWDAFQDIKQLTP